MVQRNLLFFSRELIRSSIFSFLFFFEVFFLGFLEFFFLLSSAEAFGERDSTKSTVMPENDFSTDNLE